MYNLCNEAKEGWVGWEKSLEVSNAKKKKQNKKQAE